MILSSSVAFAPMIERMTETSGKNGMSSLLQYWQIISLLDQSKIETFLLSSFTYPTHQSVVP
jgi:hypothetical protein